MNKSLSLVETSFTNLREICLELLESEDGTLDESVFLERIKCSKGNKLKQSAMKETVITGSAGAIAEDHQTVRVEEGKKKTGLKKMKRKEITTDKKILQSYESSYVSECVSHLKNQYSFLLQHFYQEGFQLVDYLVYSQPSSSCIPSPLPLSTTSIPPSLSAMDSRLLSSNTTIPSAPFSPSRQQLKEYLSFHIQQVFFCSVFDIQNESLLNIPSLASLDGSSPLVLSLTLGKQFAATWHQQLHDYFVRLASPLADEEEAQRETDGKDGSTVDGQGKKGQRDDENDSDDEREEDDENASQASSSTSSSSSSSSTSNVRKNFSYNPFEEWKGLISFDEIEIVHRPASSNQSFQSLTSSCLYSFPYLRLTINKDFPVLLHTSSLLSLSFYSFVEEISDFIGKNQLLKRSFLLCQYFLERQLSYLYEREEVATGANDDDEDGEEDEARENRRKKKKLIFSEEILWIMLLSVFNRYLPSLDSPLQVLMLLMMEMSCYDPKKHIVTIFGIFDIIDPAHLLSPSSCSSSSSSTTTPYYPPAPVPASVSSHLLGSSAVTPTAVLSSSEFLPFQRTITVSLSDFAFSPSLLSKYQALLNPPTKDEILKKESDLKQLEKEKKVALKAMGKKKGGSGVMGGNFYNPQSLQQQHQYRQHQHQTPYPVSSHGGASSSSSSSSPPSSNYSFTFLIPSFYADHLQRSFAKEGKKSSNAKKNADNNFFLALHPLNHSILQTNPSLLRSINTTDGKIVELFHFGLLYFIQLYEGIRELVQTNSLLSSSSNNSNSSTRMMPSSEKQLQLLKETLIPSSLSYCTMTAMKAAVYW
jgi:hypothetical protein